MKEGVETSCALREAAPETPLREELAANGGAAANDAGGGLDGGPETDDGGGVWKFVLVFGGVGKEWVRTWTVWLIGEAEFDEAKDAGAANI